MWLVRSHSLSHSGSGHLILPLLDNQLYKLLIPWPCFSFTLISSMINISTIKYKFYVRRTQVKLFLIYLSSSLMNFCSYFFENLKLFNWNKVLLRCIQKKKKKKKKLYNWTIYLQSTLSCTVTLRGMSGGSASCLASQV